MNNMELETDVDALDMEMDVNIHYCPVIPNPEGEPTAELKTADIEGTIYKIVDEEARTELENKVDKVEGKDLSTNDYTDEDKAIVGGVTEALNGKVDKDGDKVLSDNNYSDTDKTKLDGIEAKANKTIVDTEISATSTNPLQNKAIYDLLNDLLPEVEVTGNPIEITNASGFNAKALTVDMLPIQDLHGYDKPWAGGSGKNKFDVREFINNSPVKQRCTVSVADDDTVTVTSTETGGAWIGFAVNIGGTLPTNTFTIPANVGDKFVPSGTSVMFYEIDENDIILSLTQCNIGSYYTVTNNNCKKLALRLIFASMSQGESVTFKEQIEKGETATSYEPYSNICPISGRSSLDVTVNGNIETINFGETVYGGTCNVVGGETSNIMAIVDADDLTWQAGTLDRWQATSLSNVIKKTPNNQIGNIYAEQFKATSNDDMYLHLNVIGIAVNTNGWIVIRNGSTTEKPHGKIVYELATPTTINTPATAISLNKGNNTLSTSGDNMDLKYSAIISNPTSLTMARQSLGMVVPTIDSTEDTRLLNDANIEVV